MNFSQGNIFIQLIPSSAFSDMADDWARNWGQNRGRNDCLSSVSFSHPLEKSVSSPLFPSVSLSLHEVFLEVCLLAHLGLYFPLWAPLFSLGLSLIFSQSLSPACFPDQCPSLSVSCHQAFSPSLSLSLSLSVSISQSFSPSSPPHTYYVLSQAQRFLSSTSPYFADADMKVTCSWVWANPTGTALFSGAGSPSSTWEYVHLSTERQSA